ncbi:2-deoxy-D-gluconate 3-dehydrogenase [Aureimonas sp. SA4125]|uniref:2-dehydro-3-deoxy-D-gluconate 5-dehydrogenase KduD n=1 Tax=Aureimonas sp. SA4125 TaxID=2826993 RepID=UPI001CC41F56|nr:2-dehydro-3-deoxy-D-gluconate 5-dehydrogenase KduD [Aureimonas sp. SA4125]BDA82904.1 2-deoxy-D-gluconate 3-dehydrogenase [Aureimonas sp. SA4125]
MSLFDLKGQRAFVTGANTGIGQGIALSLAQAGADIVAAGRSAMDETLALIASAGGTGAECCVDFSDKDAAVAAFERAAAERPIDILVNNAGIIRRADAVDVTDADWDDVLGVNLRTPFFLAQAFARAALAEGRGGSIINIASMLSFQGGIRVASYTASKSGIAGLTKLLACEWAPRGINVNAIAPGYIETNNTEALRADASRNTDILKRIPAGRWGEASDIGGTAVFLASAAARYVHGAVIPVDGGWLAR